MDFQPSAWAFVRDLSVEPEKEHALVDYLCAKDQLEDCWYEIDPYDFVDDASHRFDNESFRDAVREQNNYVEKLKAGLEDSSQRLHQLGITPSDIDALRLTFTMFMEIKTALESTLMKSNTTQKPDMSSGGEEPLRKLPILVIHDTEFYVDMARLQFRQVDNPKNAISFYDVQDNGDHTAVMYDPKTKNAFQGTWAEMTAREDVVLVRLPAKEDLDFEYVIGQLNKRNEEMMLQRKQSGETNPAMKDHNKTPNKGQGL